MLLPEDSFIEQVDGDTIAADVEISRALSILSKIVSGSTAEIIHDQLNPLSLFLWNLIFFQRATKRSIELTKSLLSVYIKSGNPEDAICYLVDNSLPDGEKLWDFGNGPNGGVEIRKKNSKRIHSMESQLDSLDYIEERIGMIIEFIDEMNEGSLQKLFLRIFRRWLVNRNHTSSDPFRYYLTYDCS